MSIHVPASCRPGGRKFLEDIPLRLIFSFFLVSCVVDVMIRCYLGSYRVVIWDLI